MAYPLVPYQRLALAGPRTTFFDYFREVHTARAPPCCYGYLAGAGHDWTCRIRGHAFYVDHVQSDESTVQVSTPVISPRASEDDSNSIEPLVLPPPAYSPRPREDVDSPFLELPPTYNQAIRAKRFCYISWVPGLRRLARPPSNALSGAELAELGLHVGEPAAQRSIRQVFADLYFSMRKDLTWVLPVLFVLVFVFGFLLHKYA